MNNWVTKTQQKAVARAMANGGVDHYKLTVGDFVDTAGEAREKVTVH